MMAGVILALVAVAVAALAVLGVRGRWLIACGTAMIAAATAFLLTSAPQPALNEAKRIAAPLTEARHIFYGNFSAAERWLVLSEGLARGGNTDDAVGVLQNAARRYPGDAQLWVGLGTALADHARTMTPPAEYAFARAAQLSPGYPGPRFFAGMAQARYGSRAEAARIWRALLADAPANAPWRPMVVQGLALIGEPPAP